MRNRCPRCQHLHNVDAAGLVAEVLKEDAHKGSTFVLLPTKSYGKLIVVKPEYWDKVNKAYMDSIKVDSALTPEKKDDSSK